MSVRSTLKRYAIEYIAGKRNLQDCDVPGVKWSALRRTLIVNKKYFEAVKQDQITKASLMLEKKRAESRFWLETGIRWPKLNDRIV